MMSILLAVVEQDDSLPKWITELVAVFAAGLVAVLTEYARHRIRMSEQRAARQAEFEDDEYFEEDGEDV